MAITMKEIARLANVTQPAVSAALNGADTVKVSESTRKLILEIARAHNYTPNRAAQQLKGKASRTIGIFGVPYVSELNQTQLLALSLELEKRGYNLLSCYGRDEIEKDALNSMAAKGVDGIIVTTQENPLLESDLKIPYVHIPPWAGDSFDGAVDHCGGFCEMGRYLISAGCRRIAFLGINKLSNTSPHYPDRVKYAGLRAAAEACGLPETELSAFSYEEADFSVSKLIGFIRSTSPDAVCCANDYLAAETILNLQRSGFSVPEDIKVLGYDGLTLVNFVSPPIATVSQPIFGLAGFAVELLLQRIRNKEEFQPVKKLFSPTFLPNSSCGFQSPPEDRLRLVNTFSTLESDRILNHTNYLHEA